MNKKFIYLGNFIISIVLIFYFFTTMISPGYVGVVVDMLGDSKDYPQKELHVGMHVVAPWKKVFTFPIFELNNTWENDETFHFQTIEGMAVSSDIGITFSIKPEYIPKIFQKYRRGMDEITHTFIRNFLRDAINKAASHMYIEDLYGNGKESFFEKVEEIVRSDLEPLGIVLTRIYLIGRFHFPTSVIAALNSKIEANQRAQQRENELRESEAEAKKQVAKAEGHAKCILLQAEAEAKSNEVLASSVTVELIKWQAIQKWDGKLPHVTSGAIPFIDVNGTLKCDKE